MTYLSTALTCHVKRFPGIIALGNYYISAVTYTHSRRNITSSSSRYCNNNDDQKSRFQHLSQDFQRELNEGTTYVKLGNSSHVQKQEHPVTKTLRVLKFPMASEESKKYDNFPYFCDIAIVGGGVIGCSVAYWLQQRSPTGLDIVVIERDPTYTRASTVLSVGGLRQQFSLPENIQMSLYGAEFLRKSRQLLHVDGEDTPDVQFHPHGYLFLATEKGAEQLTQNSKLQIELGAKVELLTPRKLKDRFPWISTDNVALACYGLENEGWFDPWALLEGFKNKAKSLGTRFVKGEAIGFEAVEQEDYGSGLPENTRQRINKVLVQTDDGEVRPIQFSICVIAAGAQSGEVSKMAGIGRGTGLLRPPLPVEPRKRYVYCFHCPDGPGLNCPLTVDTTGSYFRREGLGGHFVAGKSPSPNEEPGVSNLDVDYSFFTQQVWPDLAGRVSAFENIKLKSAWAGFYDYNFFDQNAIVGPHPYHSNVIFATGFSGHGIQQAPAVGRAVMEHILDGNYISIDLKRFGFKRIITNEPIFEQNIV